MTKPHGTFSDQAALSQQLKLVLRDNAFFTDRTPLEREVIEEIISGVSLVTLNIKSDHNWWDLIIRSASIGKKEFSGGGAEKSECEIPEDAVSDKPREVSCQYCLPMPNAYITHPAPWRCSKCYDLDTEMKVPPKPRAEGTFTDLRKENDDE